METNIWVLAGHMIPNEPRAIAVFLEYPNQNMLLGLDVFKPSDLPLINILLEHGVCGAVGNMGTYEYFFCHPDINGNLNLRGYLWTGVTDMDTEGKLTIKY